MEVCSVFQSLNKKNHNPQSKVCFTKTEQYLEVILFPEHLGSDLKSSSCAGIKKNTSLNNIFLHLCESFLYIVYFDVNLYFIIGGDNYYFVICQYYII